MNSLREKARIDSLGSFYDFPTTIDVLRLDLLHPVVSGNKWFKLKFFIKDAEATGKKTVLTFGGAYSNHIVATAAAARMIGLKSIGVIRGERPLQISHTLEKARSYGMDLYFISRDEYKRKTIPQEVFERAQPNDIYTIPEGGYGVKGMQGAQEIIGSNDTSGYAHFIAATGTGTTLAGIISAALPHQKIIGIPVLKNHFSLQQEINALIPAEKRDGFELLHDYHFGGYAKHTGELFRFMNEFYLRTAIPTDFVYTAKVFYAVIDLLTKSRFGYADKILIIHTGGLQGNFSLPKGTLIFP